MEQSRVNVEFKATNLMLLDLMSFALNKRDEMLLEERNLKEQGLIITSELYTEYALDWNNLYLTLSSAYDKGFSKNNKED